MIDMEKFKGTKGDIVVMYSNNDGSISPIKVDADVVRLLDIFRNTFLSGCEVDTSLKYTLKQ